MTKVRILGPRELLPEVLTALQDYGRVHLTEPKESADVHVVRRNREEDRRARYLRRVQDALHSALEALDAGGASADAGAASGGGRRPRAQGKALGTSGGEDAGAAGGGVVEAGSEPSRDALAHWARRARAVGREARALRERKARLEEERALLARYRPFFTTFEEMAATASASPDVLAYAVVLPVGGDRPVRLLREGLGEVLGDAFELWSRPLQSGETGVLILAPRDREDDIEALVREARLEEIELPGREAGLTTSESIRRIVERLDLIPAELEEVRGSLDDLRRRHGEILRTAEALVGDARARMDAREHTAETRWAFVVEGWVPAAQVAGLREQLNEAVGDTAVVEEIDQDEWTGEDVPVVLHNPRLFRPFEAIVSILPLPRYGSIDPTPFLAIFFPMFFGIVLGDVGYGVLLGILALLVGRGAHEGSVRRSLAEVAAAAAAFTIIFGFVYGELFGDFGARAFGLKPLGMHREEALLPFLVFALAIGVVHTLLGLVLNLVARLREGPREAVGPGVTLLMVALVVVALLAALDVIPRAFFTPATIAVLVLFPLLVIAEGILGPTELLSTLGHILSYARVMAVGTASVMMAVAANRMVGAMGSVLVGSIFALLFHLVNFALGIFSPTVHALRLHFVEFFGTFYSPGGTRYEPFGHWVAASGPPFKEEP